MLEGGIARALTMGWLVDLHAQARDGIGARSLRDGSIFLPVRDDYAQVRPILSESRTCPYAYIDKAWQTRGYGHKYVHRLNDMPLAFIWLTPS